MSITIRKLIAISLFGCTLLRKTRPIRPALVHELAGRFERVAFVSGAHLIWLTIAIGRDLQMVAGSDLQPLEHFKEEQHGNEDADPSYG